MKIKCIFPIIILLLLFQACRQGRDRKSGDNEGRPNILIAISDDQSFAHTGFAGCPFVNTPAFDRIAGEGIYFTNCCAGSPGCAPSRSALITGRHHWQNEQSGQHQSSWMKKYVPIVDMLEQNGYYIGRTGKGVDPFRYARDEMDSLWRETNAAGIERSQIEYGRDHPDERFADGISSTDYFENFKSFLKQREKGKPFFFWYGSREPHRRYEKDSWKRLGKNPEDVEVPGFLPEDEVIADDLLDYAVEIEWFDLHLSRMIAYLEEIGELENTVIIVTSDNGMPFPRAKANSYEYGIHVPLAIRCPDKFPGARVIEDPVGFVDLAPTLLEITGTSADGMLPMSGKSIASILYSEKEGVTDPERKFVFAGRERHSSSRYKNWGYPQRMVRSRDYLYVWNIRPERWPAGAPQRINPDHKDQLLPMFGMDIQGIHHSEWAFTDVDASPSKAFIVENHESEDIGRYFELAFDKRPEFELFELRNDPYCLRNLSGELDHAEVEARLKSVLMDELKRSADPRVVGPDPEIFESYIRYAEIREFPKPD